MKTISNGKVKGEIQNYKSHTVAQPIKSTPIARYQTKRSLNKPLLFVMFALMIGSFYAGTKLTTSSSEDELVKFSSNDTVEHFNRLNDKAIDLVDYKEINFDHYLTRLNNREYSSYAEYLAEASLVRDLFDQDMDFNRNVFNAKHDFTGRDRNLYISFNDKQRRISAEFRDQLELHKDNFKKYFSTMRKINRVVMND